MATHFVEKEVKAIKAALKELASAEGQAAAQKFHKEKIQTYGIKVPIVRALAKKCFNENKHLEKAAIFTMCDQLFLSGILEEAFIASELAYALRRKFEEADFSQFEHWIKHYVNNWAICDGFCNNTVGVFLLQYPAYIARLKKWAVTDYRWLQRAAAVSLIIPARRGLFIDDIFEIAELELQCDDDLVQKGYGWLLKVASKNHAAAVYQFVMKKKQVMPRTALRYAIEHFSPKWKKEVMEKL